MEFTDDIGNTIILDQHPERIISLVPSITATLFDLSAGNLLVGRTKFCIHPEGQVKALPVVGGTKNIHLDKIVALRPDLVLCNKEENTLDIFEEIRSAGIPVWVNETRNLEDNAKLILNLGLITGQTERAKAINNVIGEGFSEIRNKFQQKSALYLIWKDPYMSIGRDTFIHDIMSWVGLINCTREYSRYPALDTTLLRHLNPELVLLSSEPYPFREKHIDEIQALFPEAEVHLVQGEYFSWHGSMMADAVKYFRQLEL